MRSFRPFFLFFAVLLFLLSNAIWSGAQTFRPFTPLRVVDTTYFKIIFPEQSAETAYALTQFADRDYERVCRLLGIQPSVGPIPVTITPQTDRFNGYLNPLPYPHIVLYDTPIDLEWTSFAYPLESLFIHELTHAVSLESRSPFFQGLYSLFGGWVLPTALTTPLFMVEGVTVSFESLDGFGRANDPLVKEDLRQAIRENAFLTPFQASGVYDLPLPQGAYYEYGGLFSAYLQKTYGMETYGRLWRELGGIGPLSFDFYKSGFYGIFRRVYGRPFEQVWADFAADLSLTALEPAPQPLTTGGPIKIAALVAAGTKLLVLDSIAQEVRLFNVEAGTWTTLLKTDSTAYDIALSPAGDRLLLSGYRYNGNQATASVVEYALSDGQSRAKKTGRQWQGVYRARYFRQGLIALAPELHRNRIVYMGDGGMEQVLLRGDEETYFSSPEPMDDHRFAFIKATRGVRSLGIYDIQTQKAVLVRTDLEDDLQRWRYIRDLRFSKDHLFFVFNQDDRMYKLGILDERRGSVIFSQRDFSGGVFAPSAIDRSIYYRSAGSDTDTVARYPESLEGVNGLEAPVHYEPWRPTALLPPAQAVADTWNQGRPYFPLLYLNPLRFWIPLPLTRSSGSSFTIDGMGILTFLSDPTDLNTLLIDAGGDITGGMGYFDITWATQQFGIPLQTEFSDRLEPQGSLDSDNYRATRGTLSMVLDQGLGDERLRFSVVPFVSVALFADNPHNGTGTYQWPYKQPEYLYGATTALTNLQRYPWRLFGNGFAVGLTGKTETYLSQYRLEGVYRHAFEPLLPLRIAVYGAYDPIGMGIDGTSRYYGSAGFNDVSAFEYRDQIETLNQWIVGSETEGILFSVEGQTSVSHVYINRIYGTLGYRNVYNGDFFGQSIIGRLGAVFSGTPAAMVPLRFIPSFWGALRLSNLGDQNPNNDYQLGLAFSLEW